MRYAIYTLGCKVNQYESQAMEQILTDLGHEEVDLAADFDVCIINTCTVTAVADKKNRNVIRRLKKLHPEAVIAVCGCYSQLKPDEVRALGVDVVSGSAGREAFLQMVLSTAKDRAPRVDVDRALERRTFELLPAGGLAARTRAMLKVQDGCQNFCTYCVIPFARGPVRSMPLEQALREVERLKQAGYREIVLTGIEVASWGRDLPGQPGFARLVDAVCSAAPEIRIRLGSLEPRIIDEDFCSLLAGHKNLCPHFHLSMQSGCDTVLRRMGRRYDTARYLQSVRLLQASFPGCAVTTDMIVAFPGETEEEFGQSLAFIRQCSFAQMHIFPYSRRPGTAADRMEGHLPNAVKEARSKAAIAVAEELNLAYRKAMIGSVQQVLLEEPAGAYDTGHAPNSIRVYCPGNGDQNVIVPIRITSLYEDGLLGERIEAESSGSAGQTQ